MHDDNIIPYYGVQQTQTPRVNNGPDETKTPIWNHHKNSSWYGLTTIIISGQYAVANSCVVLVS